MVVWDELVGALGMKVIVPHDLTHTHTHSSGSSGSDPAGRGCVATHCTVLPVEGLASHEREL